MIRSNRQRFPWLQLRDVRTPIAIHGSKLGATMKKLSWLRMANPSNVELVWIWAFPVSGLVLACSRAACTVQSSCDEGSCILCALYLIPRYFATQAAINARRNDPTVATNEESRICTISCATARFLTAGFGNCESLTDRYACQYRSICIPVG